MRFFSGTSRTTELAGCDKNYVFTPISAKKDHSEEAQSSGHIGVGFSLSGSAIFSSYRRTHMNKKITYLNF